MRQKSIVGILALFFIFASIVCLAPPGSGASDPYIVIIDKCSVSSPGERVTCHVVLEKASNGLSEYEMIFNVKDPLVAQIEGIEFPAWAGLNSRGRCPTASISLTGADLNNRIRSGDRNVVLATVRLKGQGPGTSGLVIGEIIIKDDIGVKVRVEVLPGIIVVDSTEDTPGQESGDGNVPPDPLEILPGQVDITPSPTESPSTLVPTLVPTPVATPVAILIPTFVPAPQPQEPGTLSVNSSPQGAQVILDGISLGRTPLDLFPVTPGTHTLVLVMEGYQDLKYGTITIYPGDTTYVSLNETRLIPENGTVLIDTSPPGAEIMIDGEYYGVSPAALTLPPGNYALELRHFGYYEWAGDLVMVAGTNSSVYFVGLLQIPSYHIRTTVSEGGIMMSDEDVLAYEGENIVLSFVPDPGYKIECLYLDGNRLEPQDTIRLNEVGSDHLVEVTFSEISPDVEISQMPEADFTANITRGFAPLAVEFRDATAGPADKRQWIFGDGVTASDTALVEHLYEKPGNYSVSLTVCAGELCDTLERAGYIQVLAPRPPLHAEFSSNISAGTAPLTVGFFDNSTGDIVSREWNFGDGSQISGEKNPVHIYSDAGNFAVSLTVGDGNSNDTAVAAGYVSVTETLIDAEPGYLKILCNVENASVFLNGVIQGHIHDGIYLLPLIATEDPDMGIAVLAQGYRPYTGELTRYPAAGETVEVHVLLIPLLPSTAESGFLSRYPNREAIFSNISHQWQDPAKVGT